MTLPYLILKTLSDGSFHSGEALAQAGGVTRAAVWKAIQTLQSSYALDIHSVHGRGYRLAQPIELLDREAILKHLRDPEQLIGLDIFLSVDSTNHYLMHAHAAEVLAPWVVLAEHQSAGRGRRGRVWQSPFAGNIYVSLLWSFAQSNANFAGLSLAMGVVVCRLLTHLGIDQLGLKWPNDVLCQGKKLCGILIEMRGETHGPYDAVIGIGINLTMPEATGREIDQPWIALDQVAPAMPSRNALAAQLIDAMLTTLPQFQAHGLQPFLDEWRHFDQYRDQPVVLHQGDNRLPGIERGIDDQGALLVEHNGKLQHYYSGEISLRGL
jgi:BirA family biotin operon repressor/biotin-[acetyl-CoA-carboxylase] ligase